MFSHMIDFSKTCLQFGKNFYQSQDLPAGFLLTPTKAIFQFFQGRSELASGAKKWSYVASHVALGGVGYALNAPLILLATLIRLIGLVGLFIENDKRVRELANILGSCQEDLNTVCHVHILRSKEFDDHLIKANTATYTFYFGEDNNEKGENLAKECRKIMFACQKIHYRVNSFVGGMGNAIQVIVLPKNRIA